MDQEPRDSNGGAQMPTPKRTLRKGTRSCSECKRRKIRCFFDSFANGSCVPCKRRGTSCLGQEYFDESVIHPVGDPRVAERLERVEELLEKIIQKDDEESQRHSRLSAAPRDQSRASAEDLNIRSGRHGGGASIGHVTTTSDMEIRWRNTSAGTNVRESQPLSSFQNSPKEPTSSHKLDSMFADVCQSLHEALPSQQDINILFEAGRANIFLQAICNQYSELFNDRIFRPASILAIIPDVSNHPIILARKLLQLALSIQQLDPSFDTGVLRTIPSPKDAMTRYFELASSVTSNDKFVDSLEGMECLCLEGVYLINSGSLRRALILWRRAATMAQFMGIHGRTSPRTLKQLDPGTHVSCSVMWAHIVYAERYVSLLLNMPTTIAGNGFASEEKMSGDHPLEKFDKVQTVICGRIIDRNQSGDYNDYMITQKIDHDIQRMMNRLPDDCWRPPLNIEREMDANDIMFSVLSAQAQIVQYNLLNVLHLPYLLRSASERRFDHSKMTCTYASREVLNRWIKFRSIVRVAFCCRWVDFCAMTAALTLLLAHMDNHRNSFGDMLTHQRATDRMLIENAMASMDELNRINNDELSVNTARLARRLLQVEADAAAGGNTYNSSVVEGHDGPEIRDREDSFQIKVPYFGTVNLAKDWNPQIRTTAKAKSASSADSTSGISGAALTPESSSSSAVVAQPIMQSGYTTAERSDEQMMSSQPRPWLQQNPTVGHLFTGHEQLPFPVNPLITLQDMDEYPNYDLAMPDLIAGPEDWAFQGVDASFFDSVMNGYTASQPVRNGDWSNWDVNH
ncbi:hypothetical protein DL95DRAFT_451425 [Leptodontidium sp. 2 PMI_412]|nr:hypothetical protein DL95DRAFT_451425 [Leptodontidium sp. 2 PMI_412]